MADIFFHKLENGQEFLLVNDENPGTVYKKVPPLLFLKKDWNTKDLMNVVTSGISPVVAIRQYDGEPMEEREGFGPGMKVTVLRR